MRCPSCLEHNVGKRACVPTGWAKSSIALSCSKHNLASGFAMHLIMGGINGNYLRNITENAASETQEVLAAVAYATDSALLFDWCWKNAIPLKFYGRLDDGVAVSTSILSSFLSRKSARFQCRLVQHHHAKVIWWREYGLYIGSANLTASAWYKNVEAG